jgi:hypothetical protein
MKKSIINLSFITALVFFSSNIFAQSENPELLRSRQDAKTLHNNYKTKYGTSAKETGGTISLASLEALVAQMHANQTTEVVYRFGRTASGTTGKNMLMFFNVTATIEELEGLSKFQSINLCPTNCSQVVDDYIK